MRTRLDQFLVKKGLVGSRSQAESYIRLGRVQVDGRAVSKPGTFVKQDADIVLNVETQYVSRAALKLASVANRFELVFRNRVVLDIGSSTGGFTEFALKNGATKVIAVDVGTNQLHTRLRSDPRIELREQTDIRSVESLGEVPEIVVIDVSFISIKEVLDHIPKLISSKTTVVAMVKPQFETGGGSKNRGVIKNESMRRNILKDFETYVKQRYRVLAKADSTVSGEKGNTERFYKLSLLDHR